MSTRLFVLAKLGEFSPVGKTSVHAVLKSPYPDRKRTEYALLRYLRENNVRFSVRQERNARGEVILVFNFGRDDYEVREIQDPLGLWEPLVNHRTWFDIPEWVLSELKSSNMGE